MRTRETKKIEVKEQVEVTLFLDKFQFDRAVERLKTDGLTMEEFVLKSIVSYIRMPAAMELESYFTFGKYAGKRLRAIAASNPSYISWCLENVPGFKLSDEASKYHHEMLEKYG